jgi:ER membrane protein complex subunit 1
MYIFLPVLTILPLVSFVLALHASEAGVVDWHKTFIGVPHTGSLEASPVFHRVETRNSTTSVILTSTEDTNVLAALDPFSGSVGTL